MARIEPTVGRMVWFVAASGDPLSRHETLGQPLAAQIAHVREDGTLNLGVLDRDGNHFARQGVLLAQTQEEEFRAQNDMRSYCTWMPYQRGQAAKTEELQQELARATGGL